MNRKHSFAVRCLALVLALVMILSNANLGLTMRAQAAETETSSLFDLIATSKSGTKELNAILAYADYLPGLSDEQIPYEAAPTAADATLRQGKLAVEAVNGWVPYTYTAGGETGAFAGEPYTANVGEETTSASVVYKLDLNDEPAKVVLGRAADLAKEAAQQANALNGISGETAMIGLGLLNMSFTKQLNRAIKQLTLEDVGINVEGEIDVNAYLDAYLDEHEDVLFETYLDEYLSGDLTNDGVVNELDKIAADQIRENMTAEQRAELIAQMRAKIKEDKYEEAKAYLENELQNKLQEELNKVKKQYSDIVTGLQNRMVTEDSYYYTVDDGIYEDQLTIYAMLSEYKTNGLAHYYEHGADIIAEMEALGETLKTLLGAPDENGVYANAEVINTLVVKMGYGSVAGDINASALGVMADNMNNGAAALKKYNSYKEFTAEGETLVNLAKALVACGNVTNYSTDLYLCSDKLIVTDDSWKFVYVTLGETGDKVAVDFATDTKLTEEDIAKIIAKVEAAAKHYNVNTDAIEDLVNTVMAKDIEVNCDVELKVYKQNIVDAEGEVIGTIEVPGDAETITLSGKDGHTYTYLVGDKEYVVTFPAEVEVEIDIDDVADGTLVIKLVEDVNDNKEGLEALIDTMNGKIGRDAVVLTVDENGEYVAMDMTIDMNELVTVAETFIMGGVKSVQLFAGEEYEDFIVGEVTPKIKIQTLVDALMWDKTFTSQKLIAMGQGVNARTAGANNLLTSRIKLSGYDMAFTLNLTTVPAQMATVSKGLKAVEDYFWFKSNNGVLDISVDLPEKVYEAYLTAAIGTGYMDNDSAAELNNKVAMLFVEDYMMQLMSMNLNAETFNNTMKAMHIEKDMTEFYNYYSMVKKLVNYEGFGYTINQNSVDFDITGNKDHVAMLIALLGMDPALVDIGMNFVSNDDINVDAVVNIVNEVPAFQALVIEPGKINDAGIRNKLNTIDYTTNLVTKAPTVGGTAAVVLLADVNGNLNFPGNVIIDLNGKTINGSINVGGKVVIIDSELATYKGGAVNGTVYANGGAILGGTFQSDVSAFLRDGYFQDNGSVRNAMYYVEGSNGNYTYVLNADFYQLCDGYLPSVEALAAEIATDVAMNAFPAVGMAYNGKTMFALNLDTMLNSYLGAGTVDAVLTDLAAFINVEGINALANDIIDDLTNFKALSESLNNNSLIGRQYKFTSYPIVAKFEHVQETNTLDISLVANTEHAKNFSIGLKIEGENDYYAYAKKLLTAMADIVTIDAEVKLNQPTYNAGSNTMTIGGGASANVVVDLSKDMNYTKAMAIILAYGNPDRAEELMGAKNCVIDLNKIITDMTVEEVFTALKVMNRATSMAEMAEAVGYKYDASEIADLEAVYHVVLCGMGKVLEVLDVTGNNTKLSMLADGEASFTIDAFNKSVDATVKGFTGVADLDFAEFSLTLKLATKCDKIMGDANSDGRVNGMDAYLISCYVVGDETADPHLCVSDVNDDGKVNGMDCYDIGMRSVDPDFVFEAEKTKE